MFVNKIGGVPNNNVGFKGIKHEVTSSGSIKPRFYHQFDPENETCEVVIYRAAVTDNYDVKADTSKPLLTKELAPEGTVIDLDSVLEENERFVYKLVRKDKNTGKVIWEGADTGVKVKPQDDKYVFRNQNDFWMQKDKDGNYFYELGDFPAQYKHTLVTRNATTPLVNGSAYLAIIDSLKPGMKFDPKTGNIIEDKEHQNRMEKIANTFSNCYGGSLAGVISSLDYIKAQGHRFVVLPPYLNSDGVSSVGYWPQNNYQMDPRMGNTEDYANYRRELVKRSMADFYDATLTSEGIMGNKVQYFLRWNGRVPLNDIQTYYQFKMPGAKDDAIGLGIVPRNMENLRFKLINPEFIYEEKADGTYKKVSNPDFDPKKKKNQIQFYDASLASEAQAKDMKNPIKFYDNIDKNDLRINSHDDTIMPYILTPIKGESIDRGVQIINELNKKNGKNIKLDSPDAAMIVASLSNAKITKKTEGGVVTWDANTDMFKYNFNISAFEEMNLQAIKDRDKRYKEQKLIERGAFENQDMALKVIAYRAQEVKDIQIMYFADAVRNAKSADDVNKLVEQGILPDKALINDTIYNNIVSGHYRLDKKGILSREDATIKALMKLPLQALEFDPEVSAILDTSFFSNNATSEETVGKSRFELMKENNPHLVEPYKSVYTKVENLYKNELKNFTNSIIDKVNQNSPEKLIDANGNYTEYGEYVIELVGRDIAKYALLKSLAGDVFNPSIRDSKEITYDYNATRGNTSLNALGIDAHNPKEEAEKLQALIKKGLNKLNDIDISYVSDAIAKRIEGKTLASFRLGEAAYYRSGLGLNIRFDAAKNINDIDSVNNRTADFDDIWNEDIKFYNKATGILKKINPSSITWGEITDAPDVMRAKYGINSHPYNNDTNIGSRFYGEPDAMTKFFNETGLVSEPAYSYFFSDLMSAFTNSFEDGKNGDVFHNRFKEKMDLLMETRSNDYLRNLYTFVENQDKQRLLDGLALDMKLFRSRLIFDYDNGKPLFETQRENRLETIKAMSGASTQADVPIELRLNIDNNNYFMDISPRAVAMTKLLVDAINENLKDEATPEEKKLIKEALIDMANGNLGVNDAKSGITHIDIPEISTLEGAIKQILDMASSHGLTLSESERQALINNIVSQVNSMDLSDYLVHGDFDWGAPNADIGEKNRQYLQEITGSTSGSEKYSIYTVQLARLIKQAYKGVNKGASSSAIDSAAVDFINKYNKEFVSSKTIPFNDHDDFNKAQKKNAYAARDIDDVLRMAFEQVETKTGRKIQNQDNIQFAIYKAAIEPAVQKGAMIMEFLGGLFGTPTAYAGTELGQTGYEDKSKNNWLQNRNALPWSQEERRKFIKERINAALSHRSNKELTPLNDGTPWGMEVETPNGSNIEKRVRAIKIQNDLKKQDLTSDERKKLQDKLNVLIRDLAKAAYMMTAPDGSATVTVFNTADIETGSHVDYFAKYGLDTEEKRKQFFAENNIDSINPDNKYVPIQQKSELDAIFFSSAIGIATGTVFMNANSKDQTKYIVKEINGRKAIVREDGKKIVMDGLTSRNGVMILKKIMKKLSFKGNSNYFNKQYNIVSNPYQITKETETGKNLSLISR